MICLILEWIPLSLSGMKRTINEMNSEHIPVVAGELSKLADDCLEGLGDVFVDDFLRHLVFPKKEGFTCYLSPNARNDKSDF